MQPLFGFAHAPVVQEQRGAPEMRLGVVAGRTLAIALVHARFGDRRRCRRLGLDRHRLRRRFDLGRRGRRLLNRGFQRRRETQASPARADGHGWLRAGRLPRAARRGLRSDRLGRRVRAAWAPARRRRASRRRGSCASAAAWNASSVASGLRGRSWIRHPAHPGQRGGRAARPARARTTRGCRPWRPAGAPPAVSAAAPSACRRSRSCSILLMTLMPPCLPTTTSASCAEGVSSTATRTWRRSTRWAAFAVDEQQRLVREDVDEPRHAAARHVQGLSAPSANSAAPE